MYDSWIKSIRGKPHNKLPLTFTKFWAIQLLSYMFLRSILIDYNNCEARKQFESWYTSIKAGLVCKND